ncbi:MAG: KEOPS complex subunit Cgi121 [Candidatus Bathyarchaeota archaeon]|nr:KEOPS complex subunit Cgi121 [Candidatus Bathyarchaeum sp.]
MTQTPEEFNSNIAIAGFSNVKIEDINTFLEQFKTENKAAIQFFDAKKVAGTQHIYFAALNTLNAFKKNNNISNNMAVESLLYASAQRQITKAVNMLGLKQDSSEVAALIIAQNSQQKNESLRLVTKAISGERDDSVLEVTSKKIKELRKMFGISNLEFEAKLKKQGLEKEAIIDLVIERMALLVTKS